jgi:hypothetical protein
MRVASAEVSLAAASLLNIPANLVTDLVNIPYNEVQAVDFAAKSLFFSGPWWVVSATNLWGVDPGDPSHFRSVVNFLFPFPALSGMNLGQNDQNGLGQQLWMTAATLLPVSGTCDSHGCMPNVPPAPITGIGGIDALLWYAAIGTGQLQFPIFTSWLTPDRLLQLGTGYTFDPSYPGYVNPDGKVYPLFDIPGTVGPQNLMPWDGVTFQLNPFKPFFNYFNHLMADPAGNPIQLPSLVDIGRSVQALLASMVLAWDPITPGSPLCPGDCKFITDLHLDSPDIVKFIGNLWPGNQIIDTWVAAYDQGVANVPTQEIINRSVQLLQQPFWDFANPSPPPSWSAGFNFSTLAPFFHQLWTDLGFVVPPLNTGPVQDPGNVNTPTAGPVNALQVSKKVSQPAGNPSIAPNLMTVNLNAAPAAPDSQVAKDVSTQAQQDVQPITRAATEAPADAGAMPNNADTNAGQTPATDPTRDGSVAVPGKAGGDGTQFRGGQAGPLRSQADQISSRISKVSGGTKTGETSTGGTKTGETSTGGTNSDNASTGGRHQAGESATGGTNSDNASTGGRHQAGETGTGGTNSDNASTGGRHRAE